MSHNNNNSTTTLAEQQQLWQNNSQTFVRQSCACVSLDLRDRYLYIHAVHPTTRQDTTQGGYSGKHSGTDRQTD